MQDLRAVPNCCWGLAHSGIPKEAGSRPFGTVTLLVLRLLLNPKHDMAFLCSYVLMSGLNAPEACAWL